MKTFLQSPYFDDYDENKKFYKVLYRPSFPVQARELQQMDTMVQKQIERLGNHLFKDGAMVLDGQMSFDTDVMYIKLQPGFTTKIENLVGTTLYNLSNVKANVIAVCPAEGEDPATLFVKFVANDTATTNATWTQGDVLMPYNDLVVLDDASSIGKGSVATIQRGVYYVKSYFVLVDRQTIVLDKYSNVPSYRVGLTIKESIITPENDETLLDNAQGSYNYAAPGAHRYKIELLLDKITLSNKVNSNSFIELGQIQGGRIVKQVTKTEYSDLEKTLARRTYDESGDYTVTPFKLIVREHRNNDRGQWKGRTRYLVGDVVRNFGNCYVAKNDGFDETGTGPVHVSGTMKTTAGQVEWEYVEKPVFNNGVFPAEGKLTSVKILDGGRGYVTPPIVTIDDGSGINAKATAIISEGKVVDIILDDCGEQFTQSQIPVVFNNGLAQDSDDSVDGHTNAHATAIAYTDAGNSEKLAVGFEGGKAYVQGFELEKIGTTWVAIDKAREVESAEDVFLTPSVGNFLLISSMHGVPMPGDKIELHKKFVKDGLSNNGLDNTVIGTCRVRGLENSGVQAGVYKLFVFDIELEDGISLQRDVKSVCSYVTEGAPTFTADIECETTMLTGSIVSIEAGKVKGSGTTFGTELQPGDYILVGNQKIRVKETGNLIGQNEFETDSLHIEAVSDTVAFYKLTANLYQPQGSSALYSLPHSCVTNTDIGDVDYYVSEVIDGVVGSNGQITFSCANAVFGSVEEADNYAVFVDGEATAFTIDNSGVAGTTLVVNVDPTNTAGKKAKLFATLRKRGVNVGAGEKTLEQYSSRFTTEASVKNTTLMLGNVDVYRIDSVRMYPSLDFDKNLEIPEETEYVDISDRYQFFDGQTDSYYGESYLVLKNSYSAPEYPVVVYYTYFNRKVVGDYYNVQSYKDCVSYDQIPSYNGVRLSDVLDFRPDILKNNKPLRTSMLKRGTEIEISYQYYLGRKDRVCLDYMGNFVNVRGIASLNPVLGEVPAMSMNVANIEVKPYTFTSSADDVIVEIVDNKRYTMRDIGRLENRINTLEQYTTLSLLETQTESLLIQDDDGYDRFKQGFVVDNFKSNLLLSTSDENVRCAIDTENGVCRPPYVSRHVSLFEGLPQANNDSRLEHNYRLYGKVYTLPLDKSRPHVAIVEQPLATQIENINPYAIVAFVGSMTINPSSDDWYDTNYLPDVVNNVEGNYLTTKSQLEGTKWNDWQISWTGAKVTTGSSSKTSTSTTVGRRIENGGADYRYDTITKTTTTTSTWAQQQGQTRSGIKTVVTATTDYEVVGDRIVSTTSIPYMRSRWLLIKAKNLKPYTTYIPKFDGVNVDYWCVPASKIEYTPKNGTFDCSTGAGSDATNAARRIDTTKYSYWREETDRTCLDIGDVIVGDSGLTAVVVGVSKDVRTKRPTEISDCLYVVNIKDGNGKPCEGWSYVNGALDESSGTTFDVGETISAVRSISGATGVVTYSEPNRNHTHDALKTNSAGELYFMFWIPDGDKIDHGTIENDAPVFQFRCGDRVLTLHQAEDVTETSMAEATYSAVGYINNHERSVNAVRNAVVNTYAIQDNRTVTLTGTSTTSTSSSTQKYVYLDPLAQTFIIGDSVTGGCFLSKVDLFFATKPASDNPLPVTVQIRTVENGIPTNKVLPFSTVTLRPDQINVSEQKIQYIDESGTVVTTGNYDTPTTFEFESPVYVEDTAEYAIVILSDSTDYNVWIAQVGSVVPGQNTLVSKQPHTGVLFKSQNASTWTAVQNQDLKFTLYRANFNISDNGPNGTCEPLIGTVTFTAEPTVKRYLANNPFQTKAGSSLVRVWYDNHGLLPNMKVKFEQVDINEVDSTPYLSGTIITNPITKTVNGVNTRFLYELSNGDTLYYNNGTKVEAIGVVNKRYTNTELQLIDNPTVTLNQARYQTDVELTSVNGIAFETFNKTFVVKSVDTNSFIIDVETTATSSGYSGGDKFMIHPVINYDLIQPMFTYQSFSDTTILCEMNGVPGTSAGIDGSREKLSRVYGVVDNDNNVLMQPYAVYDQYNRDKGTSLSFQVKMTSNNSCLSPIIDSDRVGAILVNNIIDNPQNDIVNNSTLDDQGIVSAGTDVTYNYRNGNEIVATEQYREVFDNITVGKWIVITDKQAGINEHAYLVSDKYTTSDNDVVVVCRGAKFVDGDGKGDIILRTLYTDEIAPLGGSVHSKYITKPISLANTCDYLRIAFAACVPKTSYVDVYYKTYQSSGAQQYEDVKWVKAETPTQPIVTVEVGSEVFSDVSFDIKNIPSFDVVAVKVVFRGTNSAAVPKIKDLRVIACV